MSPVASIFRSLEGKWTFARTISGQGTVKGIATFQKKPYLNDALFYREEGVFTSNEGKVLQAYRDYVYRYDAKEDSISVYFAEEPERFFQRLEFSKNWTSAKALHCCGQDTYDATYEFHLPEKFFLTYFVKGPKKDYTIETEFKS